MARTVLSRLAGGAAMLVASYAIAAAQGVPPASTPTAPSQTCVRLKSELAAIDRGPADPARASRIRQYEDAINKQQGELDRLSAQMRRTGCEASGFFSLFRGQPAQCAPLSRQVQQMHGNMDRMMNELQRLQGDTADRENERRSVMVALGQNDCGPQYRKGFLETLFGPGSLVQPAPATAPAPPPQSSTYETICVRSCDGYYWPISFATVPSHFPEDERTCQRMCPEAPVSLYTYRNPGEDVHKAVSLTGEPYTALPEAFAYRKQLNRACSCRRPGESWAQALGTADETAQHGDIVVTEKRAEQMSKPQERHTKSTAREKQNAAAAQSPAAKPQPAAKADDDTHIRHVGPVFLPNR